MVSLGNTDGVIGREELGMIYFKIMVIRVK